MLRHFLALHPHLNHLLEKSLSSYTSTQLEKLVTRIVRLEENWTSDKPAPVRVRELPALMVTALVPGGRWLLVSLEKQPGCILSYDLEQPSMPSTVLIRPTDPDEVATAYNIVISMNRTSPSWFFDVALPSQSPGTSLRHTSHLTLKYVWVQRFGGRQPCISPFGASPSLRRRPDWLPRIADHSMFIRSPLVITACAPIC